MLRRLLENTSLQQQKYKIIGKENTERRTEKAERRPKMEKAEGSDQGSVIGNTLSRRDKP